MTPPGCTKVKAFMDFLIPRLDLKRIDSKGARPEADAAHQALLAAMIVSNSPATQ